MYKITYEGDLKRLFRKGWKRVAQGENLAVYMFEHNIAVVERVSGTGTPRFNISEPEEPEELEEEETEFIIPEEE